MIRNRKFRTYIYLLFVVFILGCKSGNNQYNIQKVENEYSGNISEKLPSDCDELLELIQNDGDRIQYMDDNDMQSTALNRVILYEYENVYYVVIRFQDGSQDYIYCDIDKSFWNRFVNNDDESYGKGYHNWIRPYTSCRCGR